MTRKLIILKLLLLFLFTSEILPQAKPVFSGDQTKFRDELLAFMGPSLSEEDKAVLNTFIANWDSTGFSSGNKSKILDISGQLTERQFRPSPQFIQFIRTLNDFLVYRKDETFLQYWLSGFDEFLFNPRYPNATIVRYLQNTSLMITDNLLINTGSVKWKVKNAELKFVHDTLFKIQLTDATLTCYSQRDSTEIYNVTGSYIPDLQQFHGTRGIITWEKAGFPKDNVYAELTDYVIDITRNNFRADTARLMHKGYFREPVYGVLSDQAASFSVKEKATYPRFETYTKQFRIKDIYKGIDYEGGLAFEGANVKGVGENAFPARITIFRNDTLFMLIESTDFIISASGLNSQETAATIYLQTDSVYHSNLGFSFNSNSRQVNLFRTNNPVSASPYYNTFHNLDMYFETLTWDMNRPELVISRPMGAATGRALFESATYFDSDDFLKLMALDNYHPLTRLKQFSEWYYSETFPVSEFAKWLNKPEDIVTGLCIDMANRGFVFYDRANNEVTIKQKTKDYIDSFAGKKDYDIISIFSETKAPSDNARLDLKDFELKVNGVRSVFLSDSQRVAIYPYGQQLTIGKNRDLKFNGVVQAGLFTFFGHDFEFSYDTFKLRLQRIDSIIVAVETDKKDAYGNPIIRELNSLIQLATGEVYIDDPRNKSGLKNYAQYPIVNAQKPSYIFYDRIPGLEGVYGKEDFYFRIDPFVFENVDHYRSEDMNLKGEFFAGNILKPTRQFLIIQENNSLGFQMIVPKEGVEIYDGKARLFDEISMSNKGLVGRGTLSHLTARTVSDEYMFFPDSMLTKASSFRMTEDGRGLFPELESEDVKIKWLIPGDEWLAENEKGKTFRMFANNTSLDGSLKLTPSHLTGNGIIDRPDSRITSNLFSFTSDIIKADTADYNLKSPSTSGYAFIAENASTEVNFASRMSRFHLNTDSSVVKFPEVQYICTMTDFEYNQTSRILSMETKGRKAADLMKPDELLRQNLKGLDKPTFFATDNMSDTIAFTSLSAKYYVDDEYIEAENINYIPIADALIQPENGRIKINRRAKIDKLQNAFIAVNNLHLLHSASVEIESTKRYSGSAEYNYVDDSNTTHGISFPEVRVDTLTTSARGFIPPEQNFRLSQAFSFSGDVNLSARSKNLLFTGSAGILHLCDYIESHPVKFKSEIDPLNVMIPVSEKPRDQNDNMLFSGSFINVDSLHIYPAFLSPQKSWSDAGLITANGMLWYNKSLERYQISDPSKIADPSAPGNLVSLDRNRCIVSGEGKLNFGTNFDLVKMEGAGNTVQTTDSGKVNIKAVLALDFYFSPEALKMMSDDFRMMPTLKQVNVNSEFTRKAMSDLLGAGAAGKLKEETDLFGISANVPREFNYELLLNDVDLFWNEATSSFRSTGRIGIGYIGPQPVNVYVDGFVDIQRRRTGDMIDIYLKGDGSTWYYFSYFKGVMMAQAANLKFNTLLSSIKLRDRQHPQSSTRVPYTYMIAVEDRLGRFLRRMSGTEDIEMAPTDGIFK